MQRRLRPWVLVTAGLFVACTEPPAAPPPTTPASLPATPTATVSAAPSGGAAAGAPAAAVKLASDAPQEMSGGATFTAPAGWTIQKAGDRTLLDGPEPDLHVAIFDAKGASADEAVKSSWLALHADFKRPLKLATQGAARHGWDEQHDFDYETSPNEKLVTFALAYRHGAAWTVVLVESGQAAFERRNAQFRLIRQSLRPRGYTKESFAGKTPHPLDEGRIKQITGMIERAKETAGVPGVAISLVQDGKVVFQGGFGVREAGKPAKIDESTLFIVASNTKALTTLLLAKLVDEGKFQWDTPVAKVYPSFKLGDADTTSKVLVKHLVCACTGLPRQDFEWLFEFKNATAKSEMDLLGTFQPTTKLGEVFQYSNLLASAAGFIGGAVAFPQKELGAAYDEAMRTRVFEPLGMSETTFDFGRALKGNHASPHADDIDGKTSVAAMDVNRSIIPLRPAGGAWSSVKNLTRYVQMELAKGKLADGKRLVSEENLLARRVKQVTVGETATYGMGLTDDTEWGIPMVHHGGSMIGFKSDMFWLPEQGIGGVILTNGDNGQMLTRPFIRKTLEVLFDGKPEAEDDVAVKAKAQKAELAKARERLVVPPAADVVAKLAKHYTSPALGDITVRTDGGKCVFDLGEWKSEVATRKNDDGTTTMYTTAPGLDGFEFVVAERGGKRALVVRDNQHEYVFLEAP
jgi:CubicO group peptidase (beta-lactamase class C family)